jgi:hypothetical protein
MWQRQSSTPAVAAASLAGAREIETRYLIEWADQAMAHAALIIAESRRLVAMSAGTRAHSKAIRGNPYQ